MSDADAALTRDRLVETFHGYATPRAQWRVGGEFERALVRKDGRPVGYDDPDGIRWILESLAKADGWETIFEEGRPIALTRNNASITLEPGGQVELSGAPHDNLTSLAVEMRANRAALRALADGKDLAWIATGLVPITPVEQIPWMPKRRYEVMRDYLPKKGDLATRMMKGTTSVQVNLDYRDEADCARKVHMCAGLAPLTTAIFSNSPLYENKPTGFMSTRGHIWTRTDPDRCGFPPGLRADYSHERWVDYLLDVPMMFYMRDGEYAHAKGTSFRTFMDKGIDGHQPGWSDWALHQTSVFPEVRVKHAIEVRGADCVGHELALSFCALFTGLMYCELALDDALLLAKELEAHGTPSERFDVAVRGGLKGEIGGRSLADWASDLGDLAERGLKNCLPDDLHMLDPLLARIEAGRSPAEDILDAWHRDPSPEAVIRAVAY